jgi:putative nucleotidyltransferase with HDIG domain
MLLTTVFDKRVGYAGAAVISILVAGLWGNEFNLMAVSFFVGVVGVISIWRVRDRRQFLQSVFLLAGAYICVITFMGFLRMVPLRDIVSDWAYGALNGLLSPVIVYGILPVIESIFDVTTDLSLLEFSNLNHPLLKRLSMEASGTYHHSIIVGNMSEAAAQAIGANSLLARVGSYYHDVGKIEKAEYFAENMLSGGNPHEKLNPRMSALILMNHVKKGLELARQYRLPSSIVEIIAQHHGKTLMSFFYQKAVKKNGHEDTSENVYRYTGPRPQSREAAIVMLADAVEAASRSLKEPTHSRLKGVIEDLVNERFREGQLNECPLTLLDLEQIKASFLMILGGTFHMRVEYPEKEESAAAVDAQRVEGQVES